MLALRCVWSWYADQTALGFIRAPAADYFRCDHERIGRLPAERRPEREKLRLHLVAERVTPWRGCGHTQPELKPFCLRSL